MNDSGRQCGEWLELVPLDRKVSGSGSALGMLFPGKGRACSI